MKIGQSVMLYKDIRETIDPNVIVVIKKGISGIIQSINGETVEVEFEGPYTLKNNEKIEVINDKIKLHINRIKSLNYFGSLNPKEFAM
jgi:hypothetical protein